MKKLFSFLILLVLAGLVACNSTKTDENTNTVSNAQLDSLLNTKPDWNNKQAIRDVINKYYMENVFMLNRTACPYVDQAENKEIFFEMQEICIDSLFVTSDYNAYVTVKAKDQMSKDSLLLDFKVFWNRPQKMSDTLKPHLALENIYLRKKNKTTRYIWKKGDKFWERVATASKPTM
jgi:hypothetical protein